MCLKRGELDKDVVVSKMEIASKAFFCLLFYFFVKTCRYFA